MDKTQRREMIAQAIHLACEVEEPAKAALIQAFAGEAIDLLDNIGRITTALEQRRMPLANVENLRLCLDNAKETFGNVYAVTLAEVLRDAAAEFQRENGPKPKST